jgi:hypothetical protein
VGAKGAAVHFGVKGASGTIEYSNPINVSGATAEGFAGAGNTDGVVSMFFLSDSCLKGDITASRNFRIRVNTTSSAPNINNGASATFNGMLKAQDKTLYIDSYVDMTFNGAIKAQKVYFADQWSAGGKVTLASSDNEIDFSYLGNERLICANKNVLGNGDFIWYPTGGFYSNRSTVDLNGNDQRIKSISIYKSDNTTWWEARFNSGDTQCFKSGTPAVLTVTGNDNAVMEAYATLQGNISLLIDAEENPSFTQKLMWGKNETTGSITVKNGGLRLELSSRFPNVSSISIEAGGKLSTATTNEVALFPSVKSLKVDGEFDVSEEALMPFNVLDSLEIGEDAILKFPEGTFLIARHITLNGETLALGEFNSSHIAQLNEGVTIYHIGTDASAATWIGEGQDEKVSTSENWNIPVQNKAISPTFSTKGNKAILDSNAVWSNIVFSASENENSFSIVRDEPEHKILFTGDISTSESTKKCNYKIDTPIMFFSDSTLRTHSSQTVEFTNALKKDYVKDDLIVDGYGYVSFTGTNIINGKVTLESSSCIVSGLLGTPDHEDQGEAQLDGDSVILIKHYNSRSQAMALTGILLNNATIEKPIYAANLIGVPIFETKSGTTNEIKGNLRFGLSGNNSYGSWQPVNLNANSELIFSGGVTFTHSFRPYGNGVVRFRNKPISALQYAGINPMGGKVIIETTGNTFANICLGYSHSYASPVTLEMTVSGAMTNGNMLVGINGWDVVNLSATSLSHTYTLELNSTTQKCEKIAVSNRGIIKGNYPAMFEVKTGKKPDDHVGFAVKGKVEGGVGFRMSGDDDAVLKFEREAFTSCGDLEVVSGTMEFANDASWLNGTNITVSGTGILKLNHGETFNKHIAELSLSDNGKIDIPSNVVQTFMNVYVGESKLAPGLYTAQTLPGYVTGAGTLSVYNPGTFIVIK